MKTKHPASKGHKKDCPCELCKLKERDPNHPKAHWKEVK